MVSTSVAVLVVTPDQDTPATQFRGIERGIEFVAAAVPDLRSASFRPTRYDRGAISDTLNSSLAAMPELRFAAFRPTQKRILRGHDISWPLHNSDRLRIVVIITIDIKQHVQSIIV